ncbi:unnamed protein product [Symbiodinium pilosum]|uniref:BART domain-containing protein n=1 Tax=Symbiodinium pilosum TaxID=2952 RepID=A0A812T6Q4_SYMPI|nr:unnamed protein product [Symbiodinium pilosum]
MAAPPPPPPPPEADVEELYERLAFHAPVCGSCLEPLISGFLQDPSFRRDLQAFIVARAPEFLLVCEDGSHPHVWKTCHDEYRAIFERQMQKILHTLGMTDRELTELCQWLQKQNGHGFQYDDGLNAFLEAVTVCEIYDNFLAVMFAEVGRQAGDAIDVTVPETSGPGQQLRISYLGVVYDLVVPETCVSGETFSVSVTRPPNLDLVSLFNVPDSFYGLD